MAFAVAILIMLAFRFLAFTVYTVDGSGLEPVFKKGDRIMVNRWSYGLRTGGGHSPFPFSRLMRSSIRRGDIVAFDCPSDSAEGVFVCRCRALPGDTVATPSGPFIIPGKVNCAKEDYYWLESISPNSIIDSRIFGPVPDSRIIGRVITVLYNHDDSKPFYCGYSAH